MNKEPTKLRDLIQTSDEAAPESVTWNVEPSWLSDSYQAQLSKLEHEVAEAAIERHICSSNLDRAGWDRAHAKEFAAAEELIKLKDESSHGHST